MHLYTQIYEYSASVGALEGYVYQKKSMAEMDTNALDVWTGNLVDAYGLLPPDVLREVQPGLDLTLNRAISSFEAFLEKDHEILKRLYAMVGQREPLSPDDFQKKKWFQKDQYE
ncbi:MAG: hypothetical protein WC836_19920 [Desulfobacula sp.]